MDEWSTLPVPGWNLLDVNCQADHDHSHEYDAAGNRRVTIDLDGNRTTSSYDPANRLQTKLDETGVTTYTFDANGNQRTIEEPNGDVTTQTWDFENRLVEVEHPSGEVTNYTYDPDGHRVRQDDGVTVTEFLYDGNNLLQQRDDVGALETGYTYVPLPYADYLSQHRDADSSFYLTNGVSDVTQLTDDTPGATGGGFGPPVLFG